eukprot:SAG22_NODE_1864_length_3414_cov_1.391855_1_plen_56_part_00
MTIGELSKRERRKLETMITIHVHQVEVAQELTKLKTKALDGECCVQPQATPLLCD